MKKLETSLQDRSRENMQETISSGDIIAEVYDTNSSKVNFSAFNNWSNWGNGPLDPGGYTSKKG